MKTSSAALLALFLCSVSPCRSQGVDKLSGIPSEVAAESLIGTWTYRSFRNNPVPATPVEQLLFAEGLLTITSVRGTALEGVLEFGPDSRMSIEGQVLSLSPLEVSFQGRGISDGIRDWLYDYHASLAHPWPLAIKQRSAMVGSVIRSAPHAAGQGAVAPAGVTASWIAVKHDTLPTPAAPAQSSFQPDFRPQTEKPFAGFLATPESTPTNMEAASLNADPLRAAWQRSLEKRNEPDLRAMLLDEVKSLALRHSTEFPETPLPSFLEEENFRADPGKLSLAATSTEDFLSPVELEVQNGVRTLRVVLAENQIGGVPVKLRSYNGMLVGPTIRCRPGDVLEIDLINELPPEPPPSPADHNTLNSFNTTNLHFHGLHVSPKGNSDNVFLTLPPRATASSPIPSPLRYRVEIPANHPCGTFWYHAHRHGSVAAQVASGMSGAIIVEADPTDSKVQVDEIPGITGAAEHVMVLQQIPYVIPPNEDGTPGTTGVIETDTKVDHFGPGSWNKMGLFTTVNGQRLPVLKMRPGEVARWRIVDSAFREQIVLGLIRDPRNTGGNGAPERLSFQELAADGIPFASPRESSQIELWPGYRTEVMVQAPLVSAPISYFLIDENKRLQNPDGTSVETGRKYIARIDIAGTPRPMLLPDPAVFASADLRRPRPISGSEVIRTRPVEYAIFPGPMFVIDGKAYDEKKFLEPAPVKETAEEWHITTKGLAPEHPFHIHVNSFEVFSILDPAGRETLRDGPVWRDTIVIRRDHVVKMRTRFEDFSGPFVQHCHILDHEDQGMMMNVNIVDSALGSAQPAAGQPPSLEMPGGTPQLALVIRSVECKGCLAQVAAFEQAAGDPSWPPTVIYTPDSEEAVQRFTNSGAVKKCRVIRDAGEQMLRFIDPTAAADDRRHAMMLTDRDGKVLHRSASMEPLLDPEVIRFQLPALSRPQADASTGNR